MGEITLPTIRAYNTATVKQCVIPMDRQEQWKKMENLHKNVQQVFNKSCCSVAHSCLTL